MSTIDMDDLSFLDNMSGAVHAALKVVIPDGQVFHISDYVCPSKFLTTCPLMYHAFESDERDHLQANIEANSVTSVIALLRFCYTGSYLPVGVCSEFLTILRHAEIYKLALNFDVPELHRAAYGNFACQIECAGSFPTPLQDLCETIRFVYKHFGGYDSQQQHGLVSTLLHYCVSAYLYHKLGEDAEFLKVVDDIPSFRQDLCRTNIAREFADDCASDIIRLHEPGIPSEMSYSTYRIIRSPSPIAPSRTWRTRWTTSDVLVPAQNIPERSSSNATLVLRPKPLSTVTRSTFGPETACWICGAVGATAPRRWCCDEMGANDGCTMAEPPKGETGRASALKLLEEDEGFSVVERPTSREETTPDDHMSSPEPIMFPIEDDWTMLSFGSIPTRFARSNF